MSSQPPTIQPFEFRIDGNQFEQRLAELEARYREFIQNLNQAGQLGSLEAQLQQLGVEARQVFAQIEEGARNAIAAAQNAVNQIAAPPAGGAGVPPAGGPGGLGGGGGDGGNAEAAAQAALEQQLARTAAAEARLAEVVNVAGQAQTRNAAITTEAAQAQVAAETALAEATQVAGQTQQQAAALGTNATAAQTRAAASLAAAVQNGANVQSQATAAQATGAQVAQQVAAQFTQAQANVAAAQTRVAAVTQGSVQQQTAAQGSLVAALNQLISAYQRQATAGTQAASSQAANAARTQAAATQVANANQRTTQSFNQVGPAAQTAGQSILGSHGQMLILLGVARVLPGELGGLVSSLGLLSGAFKAVGRDANGQPIRDYGLVALGTVGIFTVLAASLAKLGFEFNKHLLELNATAVGLGVTTEQAKALNFIFEQSGHEFEIARIGLRKIQEAIAGTGNESLAAQAAIERLLGRAVNPADQTLDIFLKLSARAKDLKGTLSEAADFQVVYGRSVAQIVGALTLVDEQYNKVIAQIINSNRYGKEAVEIAAAQQRALTELGEAWDQVRGRLAKPVTAIIEFVTKGLDKLGLVPEATPEDIAKLAQETADKREKATAGIRKEFERDIEINKLKNLQQSTEFQQTINFELEQQIALKEIEQEHNNELLNQIKTFVKAEAEGLQRDRAAIDLVEDRAKAQEFLVKAEKQFNERLSQLLTLTIEKDKISADIKKLREKSSGRTPEQQEASRDFDRQLEERRTEIKTQLADLQESQRNQLVGIESEVKAGRFGFSAIISADIRNAQEFIKQSDDGIGDLIKLVEGRIKKLKEDLQSPQALEAGKSGIRFTNQTSAELSRRERQRDQLLLEQQKDARKSEIEIVKAEAKLIDDAANADQNRLNLANQLLTAEESRIKLLQQENLIFGPDAKERLLAIDKQRLANTQAEIGLLQKRLNVTVADLEATVRLEQRQEVSRLIAQGRTPEQAAGAAAEFGQIQLVKNLSGEAVTSLRTQIFGLSQTASEAALRIKLADSVLGRLSNAFSELETVASAASAKIPGLDLIFKGAKALTDALLARQTPKTLPESVTSAGNIFVTQVKTAGQLLVDAAAIVKQRFIEALLGVGQPTLRFVVPPREVSKRPQTTEFQAPEVFGTALAALRATTVKAQNDLNAAVLEEAKHRRDAARAAQAAADAQSKLALASNAVAEQEKLIASIPKARKFLPFDLTNLAGRINTVFTDANRELVRRQAVLDQALTKRSEALAELNRVSAGDAQIQSRVKTATQGLAEAQTDLRVATKLATDATPAVIAAQARLKAAQDAHIAAEVKVTQAREAEAAAIKARPRTTVPVAVPIVPATTAPVIKKVALAGEEDEARRLRAGRESRLKAEQDLTVQLESEVVGERLSSPRTARESRLKAEQDLISAKKEETVASLDVARTTRKARAALGDSQQSLLDALSSLRNATHEQAKQRKESGDRTLITPAVTAAKKEVDLLQQINEQRENELIHARRAAKLAQQKAERAQAALQQDVEIPAGGVAGRVAELSKGKSLGGLDLQQILLNIGQSESGFNPKAVGAEAEHGIFQFKAPTAAPALRKLGKTWQDFLGSVDVQISTMVTFLNDELQRTGTLFGKRGTANQPLRGGAFEQFGPRTQRRLLPLLRRLQAQLHKQISEVTDGEIGDLDGLLAANIDAEPTIQEAASGVGKQITEATGTNMALAAKKASEALDGNTSGDAEIQQAGIVSAKAISEAITRRMGLNAKEAAAAIETAPELPTTGTSLSDLLGLLSGSRPRRVAREAGPPGSTSIQDTIVSGGDLGFSIPAEGKSKFGDLAGKIISKGATIATGIISGLTAESIGGKIAGFASAASVIPVVGPLISAVGSIVGGVADLISSQFKARAQKAADDFGESFKKINDQLRDGSITLGEGIAGIQKSLETARAQLGSGKVNKKGGAALLKQIETQAGDALAQLRKQAKDLQDDFAKSLDSLRLAPELRSIQSTFLDAEEKIKAFLGSFETGAEALAHLNDAADFLRLTLQDLKTTAVDSLNAIVKSEQDAQFAFEQSRQSIVNSGKVQSPFQAAQDRLQQLFELERKRAEDRAAAELQETKLQNQISLIDSSFQKATDVIAKMKNAFDGLSSSLNAVFGSGGSLSGGIGGGLDLNSILRSPSLNSPQSFVGSLSIDLSISGLPAGAQVQSSTVSRQQLGLVSRISINRARPIL